MMIHPGFIGIDVSKHYLDVCEGDRTERFANTAESARSLACRWQGSFVLFEATGRYDLELRKALEAAGVTYARVNPARARDFARATGRLAKTDAIDARVLATMAQSSLFARERASDPEREALARAHKRRDQLVHMRQQERTRLSECGDASLRADIEAHIRWLDTQIAQWEGEIERLVAQSASLAQSEQRLRSIPGIGPSQPPHCWLSFPSSAPCRPRRSPLSPASPRSTSTAASSAAPAKSRPDASGSAMRSTWLPSRPPVAIRA